MTSQWTKGWLVTHKFAGKGATTDSVTPYLVFRCEMTYMWPRYDSIVVSSDPESRYQLWLYRDDGITAHAAGEMYTLYPIPFPYRDRRTDQQYACAGWCEWRGVPAPSLVSETVHPQIEHGNSGC